MASTSDDPGSNTPEPDINITPLADVMLVLLIIFMITAPLMSHKIKVNLPDANPHQQAESVAVTPIDLAVEPDGTVYWNDSKLSDAIFQARLRVAASNNPQPALNIRADKTTHYSVIWKIMQEAKAAGMVHVGFITEGGNTGSTP
ncbi:MAG TPA: biopolymer transporter ExbD [Rhodanobacteraceae bacterium]